MIITMSTVARSTQIGMRECRRTVAFLVKLGNLLNNDFQQRGECDKIGDSKRREREEFLEIIDEITLCNFRHLLEEHGLNKLFFDAINRVMVETGHMMKGGAIVDATIIDAPSSTKNAEKKREPEMHSAKKGNQWRFGMKCPAGVDAGTGYVHRIEVTAANVHDVTVAHGLIREDDEVVYGDSAYLGFEKRTEVVNDEHLSSIEYRVNLRPGRFPKISDNAIDWTRWIEKRKSSVRRKVEHIFRIIKCQFG